MDEWHRAGSVDSSNVVAHSPRVYSSVWMSGTEQAVWMTVTLKLTPYKGLQQCMDEWHRTGCVDSSNVVVDSPGVYSSVWMSGTGQAVWTAVMS